MIRRRKGELKALYPKIKEMYVEQGKTDSQIAEELDLKENTVYTIRRKLGVPSRNKKSRLEKPNSEQLEKLWEESVKKTYRGKDGKIVTEQGSASRVAEVLGVSTSTATEWLKEEGLLKDRSLYSNSIEKVRELYLDKNLPIYRVAKVIGVGEGTISSWLERDGVEVKASQYRRTPSEQEEVLEKIKEAKSDPEYKERIRQSNLKRWGREWPNQTHLSEETIKAMSSRDSLLSYIRETKVKSVTSLQKMLGCGYTTIEVRLKDFGLWDELDHYTSKSEQEVINLVRGWGLEAHKTRSVLGRQEIDIYVPEKKIGIEYNGSYWHSDLRRSWDYHAKKSKLGEEKGVFIYHIFEYEWEDERKRGAIQHQLRNLLGLNSRKVGARSTKIREVSPREKNEFLNEFHVQGADRSSVKLGLYLGDELLSIMTFARPRFSKKYEWEISRFCVKGDVNVMGGAKKLFSHFVREYNPESIVSYSDNAKTKGQMYEGLGFKLSHISSPNYVWTDVYGDVKTRYQTQMKNEDERMRSMDYFKVYDCGNKVWVYYNSK